MKEFFKMFFASLLAMLVIGAIMFGLVFGFAIGLTKSVVSDEAATAVISDNSVLVLNMDEKIHEQSESNSLAAFLGGAFYSPGLYDITQAIDHAKSDDKIKGILIRTGFSPNGMATLQQLRNALQDFKSSGKFIYAYGEMIPQRSYYLASMADSIYLNPAGFFELKGLSTELMFFKGTLEKLEVEPEIFYAGKFKSATEPFRADKISDANRIQIKALQEDIWNEFLMAAGSHAAADTSLVHQWAVEGAVQFPEDALQRKLVNGIAYWDEMEDRVRKQTGRKADEKIRYVNMDEYASQYHNTGKTGDDRIALIFAEGNIVDGEKSEDYQVASKTLVEDIRKIRKNKNIKAVVMRVNSPGGSALASEVILRELQLLQKEKPLIVSMGDVAASGGYYIACAADSIFALPNTITGSIGVFAMLFNAENLMKNKLGISFDGVKNAPYADFPSVTRPLNEAESKRMQQIVDRIYATFKSRVVAGRNLPAEITDSISQGRVYTGTDALELGLIDGLGGMDRALVSAAAKAGLKDYKLITYPEPVDRMDKFLRQMGSMTASSGAAKYLIDQEAVNNYEFISYLKNLKQMNGKAVMWMPFNISFN